MPVEMRSEVCISYTNDERISGDDALMKWPMMFRGLTGWAAAAVWIGAAGWVAGQSPARPGRDAAQQVFAASDASPSSVEATEELARIRRELGELQKSVDAMSRRLGRASQAPTTFNTFERRLEDLQRRLDRLERELNTRIKKLEDQVQRLERQSKGRP